MQIESLEELLHHHIIINQAMVGRRISNGSILQWRFKRPLIPTVGRGGRRGDDIDMSSNQRNRIGQELANTEELVLEGAEDSRNQQGVLALYEALRARDVGTVQQILAPDLEWWFHGPPAHQFMMRLLTGVATDDRDSFCFVPLKIETLGSFVLVEGCDRGRSISWVHAWTLTDGIITQVREYFNTSLTVTRLGASSSRHHCPSVWESSLSDRTGKSVPGLVLAI